MALGHREPGGVPLSWAPAVAAGLRAGRLAVAIALPLLGCTAGTTPGRSRTEPMPTWPATEGPPTLFGFWGAQKASTEPKVAPKQ